MKRRVMVFGSLLLGATIAIVGLGVEPSQADQINNNGNHYGQNGQTGQSGNNGNHYGWYKNENTQYSQNNSQNLNYSSTYTNGNSVPGPDTLMLLGAGLSGLVIWRRMSRKA